MRDKTTPDELSDTDLDPVHGAGGKADAIQQGDKGSLTRTARGGIIPTGETNKPRLKKGPKPIVAQAGDGEI